MKKLIFILCENLTKATKLDDLKTLNFLLCLKSD